MKLGEIYYQILKRINNSQKHDNLNKQKANMKKIGIVLIILICGVGLLFFLKGTQEQEVVAADFLPSDVLFYGEQIEFSKIYQQFLDSRLGRTLTNLDYKNIVAELGGQGKAVLELDNIQKKILAVLDDPAFNELFGREFSVTLFPANSFSADNPAKALEERLLLIAKPRHNVQLLQLLAPILSKDIQQSTAQYGSHIITKYKLDESNTIATVTVKGLIIAALEERLVRKALDHFDTKENTLSGNMDFQRLRKNFQGTQLFSYLSIPSLFKQGQMISENLHAAEKKEFLRILEQWRGWGAAAYGAWQEKGVLTDKAEIIFDHNNLDSRVARLCDVKPVLNRTLGMVPADSLFYYWTNTLNLPLLWELYSATITPQQPQSPDLLRKELRDSVGVELEELLDMIDKEFAVVVKDAGIDGIPLPKATVIIQLKEPDHFLKIFHTLLEEAEIPLSRKKFEGHTITYWGFTPQGGLQPAFTLIDNYLLLSNSSDLVKQIVSLKTDQAKTLLNSKEMQLVGKGLNEKNNSAAYIHIALLADALKNMASWAASMAIIQGPEVAKEADIVVNQLVLPLLDGLSMYTKLGSRSVITEDSIILESTTTVTH